MIRHWLSGLTLLAALPAAAQAPVDSGLATVIAGIRAIDNHAHPLLPPNGGPRDTDYDALPLAAIPPFPLPVSLAEDNPRWAQVRRALYGVDQPDAAKAARARIIAKQGENWPSWALDQMGTDVMLANRVAVGPGLMPPRFRWVAFFDPLLFPLSTAVEEQATPDVRSLYPHERRLLTRYLAALHRTGVPPTLDEYLSLVVEPMLDRVKREGAVAIKYEVAYLRPLDFGNPSRAAAAAVYARYVNGGTPTHVEYKTLEDFLFREIDRQAGKRGLPVHIHCADIAGSYYRVAGAQPLLLEDVFNDSTLRGTKFVLLHGGWPQTRQTMSMLGKPNVYTDISFMDQMLSPTVLAGVLREWLGEYPDKVLFGTDAFADHNEDAVGWVESGWIAAMTARRALGIALTGMMRDGEISRERAEHLARMVLRENAAGLYGFPVQ
jgi:predicted TIM-barrel fold metal-dependent hydrolase